MCVVIEWKESFDLGMIFYRKQSIFDDLERWFVFIDKI